MTDSVESTLGGAFDHWWTTVQGSHLLRRVPGTPTLRISDDPENRKTALIWPRERPEIEVFSGFLNDLRGAVNANADALRAACLRDVRLAADGVGIVEEVPRMVLDLCLSFVLLHEMFHVLCGHTEEFRHRRGGSTALALDEVNLGMASGGASRVRRGDMLVSYYRELEADDTAVQWLIRSAPLHPLPHSFGGGKSRQGRAPARSMSLLRGKPRIVAFRLLLAALWITIRLFERKRGPELRERSAEHPLPAARVLAGVATVMEEFAAVEGWRMEPTGERVQTLSDRDVTGIRTFLRDVLKPMLTAPWTEPDTEADDDGFRSSPVWIAKETGNLLLRNPPETAPGRELNRIERLRPRMLARLETYRCFNFNG